MEQELRNQQMRVARDVHDKEEEATRLRQRLTNFEVQIPGVTQERDMAMEETKHVRRQLEAETEARLRVESLRVEEQVDIRKALQTSQQALEDRNREIFKVKEDYQKVVEAHKLEAQRTAELNSCVGPLQKQLVQAQTLAGEATRQARETIGEMESRCRVLAEKYEAEKRRNGDVTRELGAAYEAARILQVRNKGVEAVRPVNHHLADLVEWKEQALRTLQSQRAALNAMSQTQNQTHARIAAVRGGAFDPKEVQGSSSHDENYPPVYSRFSHDENHPPKPAKEDIHPKAPTQANGSFASTAAPSQSHALFDTTQVSEPFGAALEAHPSQEPERVVPG